MNPTVSIIISAYNAETTLDRCLESILTQSLRDIEVLCINDGSTDGTGEILKQWEKRDGRVRVWQFEENKGILPAEHLGISASKGDYIMFVDSDDRLLPGACENLVRLIREYKVDIMQFGVKINVLPGIDESHWKRYFAPNEWISEGARILYDCYSIHRLLPYIWNRIYRGDVCRMANASMPVLHISQVADVYQTFFFLYYAKTFRCVPDGPYYEYFVGNGISTRTPSSKQFADLCACSIILPTIEEFLRRENSLENNRFLLEAIEKFLKVGVLDKLLTLPEITKETIDLAVTSWGSEILYDFIKATGLLDVKCASRYKLVPALVNQIRKQNRPTVSAGVIRRS